jgi:adenylate kinase family enzyme
VVRRVVVLGRGGAGKSTFASKLSTATGLPLLELDKEFWSAGLEPMPLSDWRQRQTELAAAESWILDGDLGPYDDPAVRLLQADTVVVLDLPLWLCVWRAARRGRERRDFWQWVLTWRRRSWPKLNESIQAHVQAGEVIVLSTRREVARFLEASISGPAL